MMKHVKRTAMIATLLRWFDAKVSNCSREVHCQHWWVYCTSRAECAVAHAVAAWWLHPIEVPSLEDGERWHEQGSACIG